MPRSFTQRAPLLFSLCGLALAAAPALAQTTRYSVTDLGTFGGPASAAYGVNNNGQVTGNADTTRISGGQRVAHAFLYSSGTLTDIDTPNSVSSVGAGINNNGVVVGSYAATGGTHAFYYDTTLHDIGTLGGANSLGFGINDAGQITGQADLPAAGTSHAFLYSGGPSGTFTDLGTFGGSLSAGYGLNASGQVTGYAFYPNTPPVMDHAFLYSNGSKSDIGTLGGRYSEGYSINNASVIVGGSYPNTGSSQQRHPFFYTGGHMYDLGLLGGVNGIAKSISNPGQIVGFSDTNTSDGQGGFIPHAFYYNGGQIVDLNTLIPSGSGWTLSKANAVNDRGQIVGYGIHTASGSSPTHAFLLTPLPSRFDLNNDGSSDLVWENSHTGQVLAWNMNDQNILAAGAPFNAVSNTAWYVAGVGDVNADGHSDLLWENSSTGQLLFWLMGGANGTDVLTYGPVFASLPVNWRVASMADFNGDGSPDLLLQNSRTGQLVVWYVSNMTVSQFGPVFATVADTTWRVAGTGDTNGDGHPDIIWQNTRTGQVLRWLMGGTDGTSITAQGAPFATVSDTHWQIVGTGDINGDGYSDLVWENTSTGQALRWLMLPNAMSSGETVLSSGAPFATVTDTNWHIAGVH